MLREIVFDTETTGLSPTRGDRMVEIGCLEMIDRRETGRSFHAYFNPERDMPPEAEAVHGLSSQFLADKPLFADRADALLEFLGDAALVAHNAAFDFGFLNAELVRIGRAPLSDTRMICTVQMARRLHPGSKHSLDALCVRYGIDRSHRVKHGALLDAELLVQLYIEMTGGRQIGLGLDAVPGADEDGVVVAFPRSTAVSAAPTGLPISVAVAHRPHCASAEERQRHAAFVAKINNALWGDLSQTTP